EYKKALEFLKKGCKCGCSTKIPQDKFAQLRTQFQNLSLLEKDAVLMGQLLNSSGGDTTTSSRFPKRERVNKRTFYFFEYKLPTCQETYLNMLGISRKYLENVKRHLFSKGLSTRVHGNIGKIPQRKTKMLIDQNVRETVENFIKLYAEKYGLPSPEKTITLLPTDMSYKSVHKDFLDSLPEDIPHIQFMSPRSDLCDTCHQLPEKEREYYNQNAELFREQRELVEENYLLKQGKVEYRSPSQTYFLTARKVHLFGIHNEATHEQINPVLDENEIIESIREIKELVFPVLNPPPLTIERQEYLYEKIRPLISEKFKDIVCPQPILDNIPTNIRD
ncbi:3340_t:CDS:2, partial [Racocetra persica]